MLYTRDMKYHCNDTCTKNMRRKSRSCWKCSSGWHAICFR